MALPLRFGGMGILSHPDIAPPALSAGGIRSPHQLVPAPSPPIWTLPKEHDPNPSINGASSSGRINRTTS